MTEPMVEPIFLSSGDLIADRRYGFGRDFAERGDLAAAADVLAQAVEIAPGFASAWFALGDVRERNGDGAGATEAFGRALAADPEDRHGASLRLARLGAVPAAAPRGYVRALFDQYAPIFDRALTQGLDYRAPDLLHAAVSAACTRQSRAVRFARALDLGCGTGLAGAAFRSHIAFLAGVDLSERMIAQARSKEIYDALYAGDMLAFLHGEMGAERYDLVLAADVLVYCGDLTPSAQAIAQCLGSGGLFAFTVETHDGEGVILRDTLRFAHAADHVRTALAGAGLTLLSLDAVSTRSEKGIAVPGLAGVAAPAASSLAASATS
jgi:predicted TPR repeat methyltransferase